MDDRKGSLEKLQKKLQENPTPTESGPSVPSQRPPVATEVTKRPTEGKQFLDEAVMKEMLAKAPDEKAFDQRIINDQVNEQLAVYYDSKSSDAQRVIAKSKIDELYKIRDRREEIKKALYGTNPAVGKTVPAKETKRVTDNTQAESQPTIKLTSAVEKTVTSNPAPAPDTTVSPKLPGGMTEMAAIAKGKSLSDIGSIGVRNTTTAELGQTWKVKVDPKADMPEVAKPINPAKFQTSGAATGSFHGRFGGFAEPHPEGVAPSWSHYQEDSDSKPAAAPADKISSKATSSKKEAAVKKAKSAGETKKKKLTKAEKEIEDRTHSDSMLGPVIPGTEADTRTEEEKIQGDAWEKAVGGVPEPEKNTEKQLTDEDLDKMMDDAAKQDVESAAEQAKVKFDKVKGEWKEARTNSDRLEKEFNEKYEKFLADESKGWRKWANLPRRIVGLKPKMTDEIQSLYEQSELARSVYFDKASQLKDSKEGGTYGQSQKVVERYQRLLAHKLVVGVHGRRLAIQEKVALDARKNSQILPALEQWRRYRYVRWGATALGYAIIGGATGGVGAAILASGSYGSRLAGAMILGGLAGTSQRAFGTWHEKLALKDLNNAESQVKGDFFKNGFAAAEKEVEMRHRDLEETRYWNKATSVAVAAAFGAYGANMGDDYFDTDGTPSVPETKLSPAPHAPSGTNPPPWEGSTTNTPKVELPNEALKPEAPSAAEFMGDMKASEAMQPKVEEALSGLPNEDLTPPSELIDAKMHTVIKGDNVWNIMEGKGPDTNPIGGESEVLRGMLLAERQAALDRLVEYAEQHPEFAKEAGAVKSGGNIHRIYPGENINVSMLDDKLRELLGMEAHSDNTSATVAATETADGTPLGEVEPHEPIETDVPGPDEFPEHGPVSVQGKDGVYVVEGRTADVNQMTLRDASNLLKGVMVDDPNALALLEEMNTDKTSFLETVDSFVHRTGKDGTMNFDLTISEWMKNSVPLAQDGPVTPSMPANNGNVPDVTPYGFDQPTPNPDTVVREASVSGAEAVGGQSLESYVRSVEQPKNGFLEDLIGLGKPNVAGTFEQMANLTIGDIKAMDVNGELPEGVSDTGFDVWSKEVANAAANDNDKTLAEYVSGLANSRAA